MRSAAFGLGWLLWRRHRIGLSLFAGYLVALAFVVRLLPGASSEQALRILTTPFGFGLLYLMAIFANSDTDLASTRSGYAYHLFTLPVRTRSLILWPMLYGSAVVALVWIFYAAFVLAASGTGAILWWPAALAAALTSCLQALAWYPVPLPYLRGILAFFVLCVLLGTAMAGTALGLSSGLLSIFYLSIIPLAALIATRGISLAREGENRERAWLPERQPAFAAIRPFTSPAQAQVWLEWKRNGPLLPLLSFLTCLLFAIPVIMALHDPGNRVPLGIGSIQVHISVRLWLVCLLFTPLIAVTTGCCPNKSATFRPDLMLQPFLAIRPLSTTDLVLAKLRMAAISTLSAWAIVLIFLGAWLLLPGEDRGTTGSVIGLVWPYLTVKTSLVMALLLLCMIAGTWQCQVSSLCVELAGRRWLVHAYAIIVPMILTILIGWSVSRATVEPMFIVSLLPYLMQFAVFWVIVKSLSIVAACAALRRYNLVTPAALGRFLGGALLVGIALWGLWVWLLPPHLVPASSVAVGVFLYLPLARLLLAPLAMHWNRHR